MSMDKETKWLSSAIIVVVLLIVAVGILSAHMEAKTYRRITGKQVTTWDALWVDLRIVDQPSK